MDGASSFVGPFTLQDGLRKENPCIPMIIE
jgi:hypothetical protein